MLEKYLNYLKNNKHFSDNTINSYRRDLEHFFLFLDSKNIDVEKVNENILSMYIFTLKDNKLKISSINRKIVSIRSFYNYYCSYINEEINNPVINFNTLKNNRPLPTYLDDEEVKILLTPNEKKEELRIRNQAIILVLLYTGLRVSELVSLDISNVDFDDMVIQVIGKGFKERFVFFPPFVSNYLKYYIENSRNKLTIDLNNEILFINSNGTRITSRTVENILNDRVKQSPIPFKVSPHMLRHTFATKMLNNNVDLRILQELLGHESLSTTQIYTHVSKERLKEVYENTFPLAKALKEKENERNN